MCCAARLGGLCSDTVSLPSSRDLLRGTSPVLLPGCRNSGATSFVSHSTYTIGEGGRGVVSAPAFIAEDSEPSVG